MTYIVGPSTSYPYFLPGDWVDFETKVTTLGERSEVSSVFMGGKRMLSPTEVPEILRLSNRYEKIPDIFRTQNGAQVVSQNMRTLIEACDPGQHQFFPIRIDNIDEPALYFILNVTVTQDSIVDEQSNVASAQIKNFDRERMMVIFLAARGNSKQKSGLVDVAFNEAELGDLCLWRERRYVNALCVSDGFVKCLNDVGMAFLDLRKARDISPV